MHAAFNKMITTTFADARGNHDFSELNKTIVRDIQLTKCYMLDMSNKEKKTNKKKLPNFQTLFTVFLFILFKLVTCIVG